MMRQQLNIINERKAIGLLIITAILWSTGGFFIKWVQCHPLAIAGLRSLISVTFLLLIHRKWRPTWSRYQIAGGIVYAAMVIFFVTGNKLTTAANVILIQYTAPIYVALFGTWFIEEKTSRMDWIFIIIVLGGLLLFFLDNITPAGFWGNICAILSGIAMAWLFMLLRKQKSESTIDSILLGNVITAIIGIPFAFYRFPNLSGWSGLLFLGIFQLGLSYHLFSIAIKHVTALESTLILTIEPILNPIWVFLLAGESPGKWAIAGGIIVFFSITIRSMIILIKKSSQNKLSTSQLVETPA
ncbi:EamA family transporter [candidate division KSB1 bacterium]|nr:EamA family transporter [candidate division KSB1 bacterium]